MTSKAIATRYYHDEQRDVNPVYSLYRHSPDFWDTDRRTLYTVVAVYSNRSTQSWLFTDIETAFRVFRRVVGLEII